MANFTFDASQNDSLWNKTEEEKYHGMDVYLFWTIRALIAVTGVSGNGLILVLFSAERYTRMSYSVYVRALAVSDTLVLISTLTDEVITKLLDRNILYGNRDICFVVMIWIIFFQALSSVFVLAIAVDRYIAVVYPLRRASLCTFRRANWVTVCLIIACFVLCMPAPIWNEMETAHLLESQEIREDDFSCEMREILALNIFGTISLFLLILFGPFCIVFVLNFRSLCVIRSRSKKQIELGRAQINTNNSQIRVTLSLIAVTLSSVLFLLPILLIEMIEMVLMFTESGSLSEEIIGRAWFICNIIQLINYAQNFYVFLGFGKEYRLVLKKLFGLARPNISANYDLSVVQPGGYTSISRI